MLSSRLNSSLLNPGKTGKIFVISAPAGTGKTTLVKKLMTEFASVKMAVSCTTRQPRDKEIDGVDYFFISKTEFEKKLSEGAFLEHVSLYGNYYGTLKESVEKLCNQGTHVVLVIDTEGAVNIKKMMDAVLIFIMPPSLEELKKRLKKRKTEEKEQLEKRLKWAEHEIKDAKHYDYIIVNDHLKVAYQVLKSIFIAEDHKKT